MENKFFFFFQMLILCNGYIFTNALVGHNIRDAGRREYPSVVCLFVIDPNYTMDDNLFCTGVFITQSHILTSQHCFTDIGNHIFKIMAEHPSTLEARRYSPLWWTTYDYWAQIEVIQPDLHHNDIAMLRIKGEASRDMIPSVISPISPPNLPIGSEVQIAGFGRTNTSPRAQILQTTSVHILMNQQCETRIFNSTGENVVIDERYLCSADNPYALLGKGDSGGPMYYQGLLVAINRATVPNVPHVEYASRVNLHLGLQSYRNFIFQNTAY